MNILLSGLVLWTFQDEIGNDNLKFEIRSLFSGSPPLYHHEGNIILTDYNLYIEGDEDLSINLSDITEIYMGFDEYYKRTFARNAGMLWQPIRITYDVGRESVIVYLIVDLTFWGAANNNWFQALKELLGVSS